MTTPTVAEIRGADRGYLAYHAPRYRYLLGLVSACLPSGAPRLLEIGPSPLAPLLAAAFHCKVDSLGLEREGDGPYGHHFHFDLNGYVAGSPLPRLPRYDVVVFAEVIEHLHVSPLHSLSFMRGLVDESGVVLLQTPNAASLPKRVKLLAGRNPYEAIRVDAGNPGHFREYTLRELRAYVTQAGFEVERVGRRFYFDARFARHDDSGCRPQPFVGTLKNSVYRALPPSLREGITLVLRKRA